MGVGEEGALEGRCWEAASVFVAFRGVSVSSLLGRHITEAHSRGSPCHSRPCWEHPGGLGSGDLGWGPPSGSSSCQEVPVL